MSFTLYYSNPDGSNAKSVLLENLGHAEGGQVTGDGVRFEFNSHRASEMTVTIPVVDPKLTPAIPFAGLVRLVDGAGVQQFAGRRIDWNGEASDSKKGFTYQFQDAWWELSKLTFKQVWFAGAYLPVQVTGTGPYTVTIQSGWSWTPNAYYISAQFYDANKSPIGYGFTVPTQANVTTHFQVTGGTWNQAPANAAYVCFLSAFTDAVLFQYRPDDPYQTGAVIGGPGANAASFYITTGAQIREILLFAISLGVNLQVGQIDPDFYVPWYPVRDMNCAEAIKICLRMHPDCFTEIDYTTTPPTFNVRQRGSLTGVTLPYNSNGPVNMTTQVKPRPDLIPSRIGIFYRYHAASNNFIISYPTDIYPVNAPDGLLALDYTIDLTGPTQTVDFLVNSTVFDPTDVSWWQKKCAALATFDIANLVFCNPDGTVPYTGSINGGTPSAPGGIQVTDEQGSQIDVTQYQWDVVKASPPPGAVINVKTAIVTAWFKYAKQDSTNTFANALPTQHPQTVRVNLINSASLTLVQNNGTGQMIPPNLAQNVYSALAAMQYELGLKLEEQPFTGFVKPGRHAINLSGGNPGWTAMNATAQSTSYTLKQSPDGTLISTTSIKCGPVSHLEPGQLVQLFNIFANRDMVKVDPWARVTGAGNGNQGPDPGAAADTPGKENTEPGLPNHLALAHVNPVADTNGQYSVVQTNVLNSGLQIFKWDNSSKDGNNLRTPAVTSGGSPAFLLDMTDVMNILTAGGYTFAPISGALDDCWKLKARELDWCDPTSGTAGKIVVLCGTPYTKTPV